MLPTDRGFGLVRALPVVASLVVASVVVLSAMEPLEADLLAMELSAVDAADPSPPTPCRTSGCRSPQAKDQVLTMGLMASALAWPMGLTPRHSPFRSPAALQRPALSGKP